MKCAGCGFYITKFKQERGAYRQIEVYKTVFHADKVEGERIVVGYKYFHVKCFLKGGYNVEHRN